MPSRRAPIIALAVFVLLAAGAAIAYFAGVFDEKGKFAAKPACSVADPSLHLLGTGYTTKAGDGGTCSVLLPGTQTTMMAITWYVGDTPGKVSNQLRTRAAGEFREVSGLGDEGYTNGGLTVFRVSNLMVGLAVSANTGTTDGQVRVFESDLASRLAQ
ncbi:hypothetical protein [Actinoplanes sp. NPDC026619]|uniref:hypothetical protein n=1 Tax=Actinoplanes sp. NPDC026619 TaxID=3155798 RepID=UPI0033DBE1A8